MMLPARRLAPLPALLGTALAAVALAAASPAQEQSPPGAPPPRDLPPESRQFDFWIGTWDVNLRIRQEDGRWKDSVQAEARIYPVLHGKAVLELWNSDPIKGFSLRYYDPSEEEWVLWLNWPGPNRSGSSSLTGGFRHGRGEFFSINQLPDGGERIARYTFSDVTEDSLRWDDAYSRDGGETWTNQWIMEFSRTAESASLPAQGGPTHTFDGGGRCTREEFRRHEHLSGVWEGELWLDDAGEPVPVTLTGHRVLGGCAVLAFLRWEDAGGRPREVFHHLTFNTHAERHSVLMLDDRPTSPARQAFTAADAPDSGDLVFLTRRSDEDPALRITFGRDGEAVTHRVERLGADGETWTTLRRARFTRP